MRNDGYTLFIRFRIVNSKSFEAVFDILSDSAEETRRLGRLLASLLVGGEIICLKGTLGAGKTTLAQGIGQGLGIDEPIISPTFTLIREYPAPAGRPSLYHIDCYRLENPIELASLGLEDYFYGDGVCVIEWPERIVAFLPPDYLWIELQMLDDQRRRITLQAYSRHYQDLLQRFKKLVEGNV